MNGLRPATRFLACVAIGIVPAALACNGRAGPDAGPPLPSRCGSPASRLLNPDVPPFEYRVDPAIASTATLQDALVRVRAQRSYTGDSDINGDGVATICIEPGSYPGGVVIDLADYDHPLFIYSAAGRSFTRFEGLRGDAIAHHAIAIRGIRDGFLGEAAPVLTAPGVEPMLRPASPEVTIRGVDVSGWSPSRVDGLEEDAHGGSALFVDHAYARLETDRLTGNERIQRAGGAVAGEFADLEIHASELHGNLAIGGGGAVHSFLGDLTVSDSELSANSAPWAGGAIDVEGPAQPVPAARRLLHVTGSHFEDNHTTEPWSDGGALRIRGEIDVLVVDSVFIANAASAPQVFGGSGGGAVAIGAQTGARVRFARTIFEGNVTAGAGGAIDARTGAEPIRVEGGRFTANRALLEGLARGGAIATQRPLLIAEVLFDDNESDVGGAIQSSAPVTVSGDAAFESNTATSIGGAVSMTAFAKLELSDVSFSSNGAISGNGGAIGAQNAVVLERVTFSDNGAGGNGGAISLVHSGPVIPGVPSITDATFTANTAAAAGGALRITCAGSLPVPRTIDLQNVDFTTNVAGTRGGAISSMNCTLQQQGGAYIGNQSSVEGGGLHLVDPAPGLPLPSTMLQVAMRANVSPLGAAIFSSRQTLELVNLLIVENEAALGAVYLQGPPGSPPPPVTWSFVTLAGNPGTILGGLVCATATAPVTDCTGSTIDNSVIAQRLLPRACTRPGAGAGARLQQRRIRRRRECSRGSPMAG